MGRRAPDCETLPPRHHGTRDVAARLRVLGRAVTQRGWSRRCQANPSLGLFGFLFVWQALELVLVWTAYVWLARFVIGRALRTHIPVREPTSASDILARQQEQYAEANAPTLTLAVAWLSIGMLGLPLIFFSVQS